MIDQFPYKLLSKADMISRMNGLSVAGGAFLFIIDYKGEQGYVIEEKEMDERYVRFTSEKLAQDKIEDHRSVPIQWELKPKGLIYYQPKFDFVMHQIQLGNSFLTNLTQATEIETNLSLLELYQQGRAKYKLWLNKQFVVLSPETFVRIEGKSISSFPMKGTISASVPNAEEVILNDPKEKAEHATIVDLIRNDLSLVAEQVEVKRYRYVEKLTTNQEDLLQVSSEIVGQLPENYRDKLGELLFTLLPAGSICGAPKAKTLEIIEKAEEYDRGFYTGICGVFDGENLDSAVMIRFVEQQGNRMVFKSGGGLTAKSELKKEYEELIQKVYVPIS